MWKDEVHLLDVLYTFSDHRLHWLLPEKSPQQQINTHSKCTCFLSPYRLISFLSCSLKTGWLTLTQTQRNVPRVIDTAHRSTELPCLWLRHTVCTTSPTASEQGYIPLHSVCGCWWWRPVHLMKPRGAPPQPAWPWLGGLPVSAPWAFHSSTNHL